MWRKQDGQSSPVAPEPLSPAPYSPPVPRTFEAASSAISSLSSEVTHLTQGISVKGELKGEMDLYVDGDVEGKIHMGKSTVTVGPNGRVTADIEAREIFVQGAVQGNLRGSDRVVLGKASRVDGDITAQRVVIEEGASFRGRVEAASGGSPRESRAPAVVDTKEGIQ